jgi:hypothetical protein
MSLNATVPRVLAAESNGERLHGFFLRAGYLIAALIVLALLVYGFDYYWLSPAERALSPKHAYLKPSGIIGLRLGMLGVVMFLVIYLYALRKHWMRLARIGNSRHWLNFHVLLGIAAPIIITFHSSFKFRGIAGVAYWIMISVALSGFVGRYIYSLIPRNLGAAEISRQELWSSIDKLTQKLEAQQVLTPADIAPFLKLPSPAEVQSMSALGVLWMALCSDLARPWQTWALRRKAIRSFGGNAVFFGIARSHHPQIESAILCLNQHVSLTRKVLFLSKTESLFRLWHIIHLPFSYSFAILAAIHIAVVLLLGYF